MTEWGGMALCVCLGAVFLFLPGALAALSLIRDKVFALAIAPAVTLVIYCMVATAYGVLDMPMDWVMVFAPAIVICIAASLLFRWLKGKRCDLSGGESSRSTVECKGDGCRLRAILADDRVMLCLYVGSGLFFTWFVFLRSLPYPAAITAGK